MTDKPKGLAALKLSDPERFYALVKKGGQSSPTNFKNMTPEARRAAGAKGGSRRRHETKSS